MKPARKRRRSRGRPGPWIPAVRRSFALILASIFLWFFAYNAVTTAFSKYAQDYLGIAGGGFANSLMLATVAAVVAFIPRGTHSREDWQETDDYVWDYRFGALLLHRRVFQELYSPLERTVGFDWFCLGGH